MEPLLLVGISLFVLFLGQTQEYLDTQRSRHIPPPASLENTLLPTIISAQ